MSKNYKSQFTGTTESRKTAVEKMRLKDDGRKLEGTVQTWRGRGSSLHTSSGDQKSSVADSR